MPGCGEIFEISRGTKMLSVEWQIQDFLSLPGGKYDSPWIIFDNGPWLLSVYPSRTDQTHNPASGWVRLSICRHYGGPPTVFNISVGIKGAGEVKKRSKVDWLFFGGREYEWNEFCSTSELIEHKSSLMPDDVLIISCVLKAAKSGLAGDDDDDDDGDSEDGEDESDDTASKSGKHSKQQNKEENTRKRIEKVVEDIGKLLSSGENSDVTVQVSDVEFKVHSFILFARSPVLSASLQYEYTEKRSKRIIIEDCEPEVFREYLQYLYTGSVRSLTERNVFGLYRIADKYLADDLKQLCLEHIRDTLSVHTFCDTVKLALTHDESGLLEQAIDFATENIRSITQAYKI